MGRVPFSDTIIRSRALSTARCFGATTSDEVHVLNTLFFGPTTEALWMTSTGANIVIRYLLGARTYIYSPLSPPKSIPYGLALD